MTDAPQTTTTRPAANPAPGVSAPAASAPAAERIPAAHRQAKYQVRFDWGVAGIRTVAQDADLIVLVDVLSTSPALKIPDVAAAVVSGGFRNRTAVARWVLDRQAEKGDRVFVAVIAAGDARDDGSIRFAVEDLLAAGAIIDALATAGIDFVSPEGAAACAAFTGLHRAIAHEVSDPSPPPLPWERDGLRPTGDAPA